MPTTSENFKGKPSPKPVNCHYNIKLRITGQARDEPVQISQGVLASDPQKAGDQLISKIGSFFESKTRGGVSELDRITDAMCNLSALGFKVELECY